MSNYEKDHANDLFQLQLQHSRQHPTDLLLVAIYPNVLLDGQFDDFQGVLRECETEPECEE